MSWLKKVFFIGVICIISFLPPCGQAYFEIGIRIFLWVFFLFLFYEKRRTDFINIPDVFFWIFILGLSAGLLHAVNRIAAWNIYIFIFTAGLPLFYIGKAASYSSADRRFLHILICACLSVVCLVGFLELIFQKNVLYENIFQNFFYSRYIQYPPRLMSTQGNPAVLGTYVLWGIPFALLLARNKIFFLRVVGFLLSGACIFIIIFTFSRGVFVGLMALFLFYFWQLGRKRGIVFLTLILVFFIIGSSTLARGNFDRFSFRRLISGSFDSILSDYRMIRMKMAIKMVHEYPWCGIGFSQFRERFVEYAPVGGEKIPYEFRIPDNMYLTLAVETGLIGFACFLFFMIALFRKGFKCLNKLKENSDKDFIVVCLAALVGLLVNMGAYDLFYWPNPFFAFCLLCGLVQGLTQNTAGGSKDYNLDHGVDILRRDHEHI